MTIRGQVQLFSGGTALGAVQIYPAQQIRKKTGAQAAAYSLPKPPATSPPEDDAIQRIAEQAPAAPRWRKWGEDTA